MRTPNFPKGRKNRLEEDRNLDCGPEVRGRAQFAQMRPASLSLME